MPSIPLYVTADDYAMDQGVDAGILDGIEAGGISNVSIWVASAPYQFRQREIELLSRVAVGLHWGAFPPQVDLNSPRNWPWMRYLFSPRRDEIARARRAWDQAADSLRRQGLRPAFINGHQHVHLFPGWILPVCQWATEQGIRVMRRPLELGLTPVDLRNQRSAISVLSGLGWLASRVGRRYPGHWIPAICRWGQSFHWEEALAELIPAVDKLSPPERARGMEIVLHPGRPTRRFRRLIPAEMDSLGQWEESIRPDLRQRLQESPFRLARLDAIPVIDRKQP